jgi:hypothetical protein
VGGASGGRADDQEGLGEMQGRFMTRHSRAMQSRSA